MYDLSFFMRVLAVVAFILAIFSVPWQPVVMLALGLTLWCASGLVPPPKGP